METKQKVCFKCGIMKDISEYYKHKQMGDGHLGKCKTCTKYDSFKRHNEKIKDKDWVESEKKRAREKYHRLYNDGRHKPLQEDKKKSIGRYFSMYPEKYKAQSLSCKLKPKEKGNHLHHWSYNIEHAKDVLELPKELHYKLHRFMIYDQERFMYRRVDTMELLDTKEKHIEYIELIKTKE